MTTISHSAATADVRATPKAKSRNLALERWEEAAALEAELEAWIAAGLAKTGRTEDPLRAQGITHVLVDFAELDRLQRSHYYDPAVTPQAVADLFIGRATFVRGWGPERAPMQALFSLAPANSGLAKVDGESP